MVTACDHEKVVEYVTDKAHSEPPGLGCCQHLQHKGEVSFNNSGDNLFIVIAAEVLTSSDMDVPIWRARIIVNNSIQ